MKEIISNSGKETRDMAKKMATHIGSGETLCFYGDLGSGKTTFIQALAKGLGIKENLTSPTFVLMKKYRAKSFDFYHMDAYRINSDEEALNLGLEEIFDSSDVIAIEWADRINNILPKSNRIDFCFEHVDEENRKISIFAYGEAEKILKALE